MRDGTGGVPVAQIPHEDATGTEVARSQQWREIGLGGFGIEIVETETQES